LKTLKKNSILNSCGHLRIPPLNADGGMCCMKANQISTLVQGWKFLCSVSGKIPLVVIKSGLTGHFALRQQLSLAC
jgi:hypothetical protein